MDFEIPNSEAAWLAAAQARRVDCFSPCDLPVNGANLPSASKMEEEVYLTFRSYWVENYANSLTPEVLGSTQQDFEDAKKFLKGRKDYGRYLEDVDKLRTQTRPLGKLPDLGAFTLVRHFQQQITQHDIRTASSKHVISPIATRSRTAATTAAAVAPAKRSTFEDRTCRQFDFQGGGRTSSRSPAGRSSRSSSGGNLPIEDSPLALRGKASLADQTSMESSPDRYGVLASVQSSQHSRTSSAISDLSAVSATAANILYAPTPDETIVNTFLILLLNALGAHYPAASAEWSMMRLAMKHSFGSSKLEARTDGSLQISKSGPAVAIVEVKPHTRRNHAIPIKMQETTQMVTWIAQEGFPSSSSHRRFVLLSQDRHEVFLTVPTYDANYIKHLKGEADATTPKSLLKMTSYGPWDIYNGKSLNNLCRYLLALTISASKQGA
ncbi:hypothetical protein FQN50_000359 [Emmonsiellopsis sp. PD_5]|nr:hypothetical protein FQN50_000359 [Emmonsiellopsis sp. PD_5]